MGPRWPMGPDAWPAPDPTLWATVPTWDTPDPTRWDVSANMPSGTQEIGGTGDVPEVL